MTQERLELLEEVKRTGNRLNALRSMARGLELDDVADILDEAYDYTFDAQLAIEKLEEAGK